tara:strand:+ start:232 stop:627 length:396 start_codon:yes stop_codon:yes gene_type:complete
MGEKVYKPLDKKKDGLNILKALQSESRAGNSGDLPQVKESLLRKYGAKQMQEFYSSLPKAAMPLAEEDYYEVPTIERMRKAGDKPVRYQWILNEPTQGKNRGGLAKKTKGFKQGGLAGTGHNDMRKGGLFK